MYLPETVRATAETEATLRSRNPKLKLATGLIHRMTGVESVHVRPDGWQASDLAVAAARVALEESPGPVDLLLFASASQDLIEPATSHIVAAKLGLDCPVMDVKNACNSVINAMQVGEALIAAGQYRRVLIASGEQPSHGVRWELADHEQFIRSFPGYTMSDGGAAVLLEATDDVEPRHPRVGLPCRVEALGGRHTADGRHDESAQPRPHLLRHGRPGAAAGVPRPRARADRAAARGERSHLGRLRPRRDPPGRAAVPAADLRAARRRRRQDRDHDLRSRQPRLSDAAAAARRGA